MDVGVSVGKCVRVGGVVRDGVIVSDNVAVEVTVTVGSHEDERVPVWTGEGDGVSVYAEIGYDRMPNLAPPVPDAPPSLTVMVIASSGSKESPSQST